MVMKVERLMTPDVETCAPEANLAHAAMIMWRRDCGFVPVVENPSGLFAGVITDRDICMATATRHSYAHLIPVREVMSSRAFTCAPTDDVRVAMHRMSEGQVRRLPVVDKQGKLKGVISLNDLALAAERSSRRGDDGIDYADVMGVLKAVSAHRLPATLVEGSTAAAT
jgi:CBS domain-containing protein